MSPSFVRWLFDIRHERVKREVQLSSRYRRSEYTQAAALKLCTCIHWAPTYSSSSESVQLFALHFFAPTSLRTDLAVILLVSGQPNYWEMNSSSFWIKSENKDMTRMRGTQHRSQWASIT